MPNELMVNNLMIDKNALAVAPPIPSLSLASVLAPAPVSLGSDPIALLLADKRSLATRRAYAGDLATFFRDGPASVQAFLSLPVPVVALKLAAYKSEMLAAGLAEATVNRRLAAVRSLLQFSYRLGLSYTDGRGLVDGEKVTAYRDTRGVDVKTLKKLVALPLAPLRAVRPMR